MAKARIARAKVTTGREHTVSESDFKAPDESPLGIYLQDVAAALTLIEDLHFEALEVDYSKIGESMGCTNEDVRQSLMTGALERASQQLVKARAALHDLFREVELKPKPAKAAVA